MYYNMLRQEPTRDKELIFINFEFEKIVSLTKILNMYL